MSSVFSEARKRNGIVDTIDPGYYRTVLDLFADAVRQFGERPAFSGLGRTLTFRELDQLSTDFAAYLQHETDLEPGDRIAIQLPNIVQYPVVLMGVLKAGLVVVNTNPLYSGDELEHQFQDSGAKALVVLANVADTASRVSFRTNVSRVIVTELADLHPPLKRTAINFAVRYVKRMVPDYKFSDSVGFRDALDRGARHRFKPVESAPDTLAMLQYTGGTTGVAKGAMLSHANLVANALQAKEVFATYGFETAKETLVSPLPLYHIYAFTVSLIMMLGGNHSLLIPNPRDLDAFIKELKNWRFTGFCGLNTLFVALCKRKDFAELDFSSLKMTVSGGMALTANAAERWQQVTGCDIYEGYGLTETSPVVSVNPGTGNQLGTIGVPLPSTEVKVIDEDGNDVGFETPGELCVRGPQVMVGYWERPEETAKVLDDEGWLKTGDMAVLREDGYIKIVDRKKDMILVSGFNVYPNEVEDVLTHHPGVMEAAVIGVPDEYSGEVVKAFVVAAEPELSARDLKDYCKQHLAGYKVPRIIEFRDELPKTNVGKVLRRQLRDEETAAGSGRS